MSRWMLGMTACLSLAGFAACSSPSQPIYTPGVAAIPKAARRESQQANLDALRLRLDDEDRAAIAALPKDQRLVSPDFAPAWDRAA